MDKVTSCLALRGACQLLEEVEKGPKTSK